MSVNERTTTYTYLPEARPLIDALRGLGKIVEAAQLAAFKAIYPADRFALATICADKPAVDELAKELRYRLEGNPRAAELASKALVLKTDAGFLVAFPDVVMVPVRVKD
jgi:hypothetical protein